MATPSSPPLKVGIPGVSITASSLPDWLDCPRRAWWKMHNRGGRPSSTPVATATGIVAHALLAENLECELSMPRAVAIAERELGRIGDVVFDRNTPTQQALISQAAMAASLVARRIQTASMSAKCELATTGGFITPGGSVQIKARADVVLFDADGKARVVVDFKMTNSPPQEQLFYAPQLWAYAHAVGADAAQLILCARKQAIGKADVVVVPINLKAAGHQAYAAGQISLVGAMDNITADVVRANPQSSRCAYCPIYQKKQCIDTYGGNSETNH